MATATEKSVFIFTPEYKMILESIFEAKNAWQTALQPMQTTDGITHNTTAFKVKTNATPVILRPYNTGANVAFGTGTSNSNRFGPRTEIIYSDKDVEYTIDLAFNEGIDENTVNANPDKAAAIRLELIAQEQVREINKHYGLRFSNIAGNDLAIDEISEQTLIDAFTAMFAYFTDIEVNIDIDAHVNPIVYSTLVKADLITTNKNSSVDIDGGVVEKFMGFNIINTPSQYFANGDIVYFIPQGIALPFIGIETTRLMVSEDFNGSSLTGALKSGVYVPDGNAQAVAKLMLEE